MRFKKIERYAFISVDDKAHLDELAMAWHEADYGIVSLGTTADQIQSTGVPVIRSDRFIHKALRHVPRKAPERSKREMRAGYLAQCMSMPDQKLRRFGLRAIDAVYINLRPPKPQPDPNELGIYNGIVSDKGGRLMIEAAIEGGRTVLMKPVQIGLHLEDLAANLSETEWVLQKLRLADEAQQYLGDYASLARECGKTTLAATVAQVLAEQPENKSVSSN